MDLKPELAQAVYTWAAQHGLSIYRLLADADQLEAAAAAPQVRGSSDIALSGQALAQLLTDSIDTGDVIWKSLNPADPAHGQHREVDDEQRRSVAASVVAAVLDAMPMAPGDSIVERLCKPGQSCRGELRGVWPLTTGTGDQLVAVREGGRAMHFKVVGSTGLPSGGRIDLADALFITFDATRDEVLRLVAGVSGRGDRYTVAPEIATLNVHGLVMIKTWKR